MLSYDRLSSMLPIRGLGEPLYFYQTIGSTNDRAAELARLGAPEGTLVVADEQTAGRGRAGTRWETPSGSGLALSLILRAPNESPRMDGALGALGALAVVEGLDSLGANSQIKWPNDVLLGGRKTAGVLAEASWAGTILEFTVLGIGVNIRPASVPPDREVRYPATCVEACVGEHVDRSRLLCAVIDSVGRWYPRLATSELQAAWERRLAFLGEKVCVLDREGSVVAKGTLHGLAPDGRLRLAQARGRPIMVGAEGVHLRPVDIEA